MSFSEVLRLLSTSIAGANVLLVLALAAVAFVVCCVQPRRARHRARRRPFEPVTRTARDGTGPSAPPATDALDLTAVRADDAWLDDPCNPPGRDPELEAMVVAWTATCRLDPARWDKRLAESDGGV